MNQEKPENLEESLQSFREEMMPIMAAELDIEAETMGRALTGLPAVRPEELTSSDFAIWQKIKDKTITMADVQAYAQEFEDVHGAIKQDRPNVSATRKLFRNIVNNRSTAVIGEREMEKLEG